jgi:hypothetical protein
MRHSRRFLSAVGELNHDMADRAANPHVPVTLKAAASAFRKPSIYFPRTADGVLPTGVAGVFTDGDELGTARPLFKVTSPTCEYFALRLPLLKAGFKRIGDIDAPINCNVLWGKSLPLDPRLKPQCRPENRWQKMNHFPGSHLHFGCKVGMATTLMTAEDPTVLDLTPRTWRLPHDKSKFIADMTACSKTARFIAKPARGSCGRGIRLFSAGDRAAVESVLSSVGQNPSQWLVVQDYVESPMLIQGRKFDFRLYVAVTSFDPLVCYLHRDGLARFAAEKYDKEKSDFEFDAAGTRNAVAIGNEFRGANAFAHLTNYSIGRKLEEPPGGEGPKLDLHLKDTVDSLMKQLEAEQGEAVVTRLKKDIDALIVRTLLAGVPKIRSLHGDPYDPRSVARNCFEVFGFDVMVDSTGRPWLIEINTLPSFESSSAMDYQVKSNVSTDLLNLALIELYDRDPQSFVLSGIEAPPAPRVGDSALLHFRDEALTAPQSLSMDDQLSDVVGRLETERDFCGGFRRLFPTNDTEGLRRPAIESQLVASLWRSGALAA